MSNIKGKFDKLCERIDEFEGDPDEMYEVHYKDEGHKTRKIEEPESQLKYLQERIMVDFLYSVKPHKNAIGFIKGCCPVDATKKHCGYPLVIGVDIKSFFHNTTKDMIENKFRRYLNDSVIYKMEDRGVFDRLLDILTKDGRLAMGAPSSPATTNIVCKSLDAAFEELCNSTRKKGKHKVVAGRKVYENEYNYTRYADDMIFSMTDKDGENLLPSIRGIVESQGYNLNEDKTRTMRGNQRQTVLGFTVNEKPNIPRDKRREFRARLHNLKCKLKNGAEPIDDETGRRLDYSVIHEISGYIAYAQQVNEKYANRWKKELDKIKALAKKRNII